MMSAQKTLSRTGVRLERHELRSDLRPAQPYHSFRWLPDARSIGAPCSRDARRHPGDHRPWHHSCNRASKRGNFTFGTGAESYSRRGNFHGLGKSWNSYCRAEYWYYSSANVWVPRAADRTAQSAGAADCRKTWKSANTWGAGRRTTTGAGRRSDARSFCAFPCWVRQSQFNGGCL